MYTADTYDEDYEVFDIMKQWVRECSHDHHECNNEIPSILPARLVFIGAGEIRLVSTANWTSNPAYMTLSYR